MNRTRSIQKYILLFITIYSFSFEAFAQNITFQKLYYSDPFNAQGKNSGINLYAIEGFKDGTFATMGFAGDTSSPAIINGVLTYYSCTGDIIWSKFLGISQSATNTNFGITEADNGDILFCFNASPTFFKSTMTIGRIDRGGQIKWINKYGTDSEYGRDMITLRDGSIMIAGSTANYGSSRQASDIYLMKLDSLGKIIWARTYGNPSTTYDEAFAIDKDAQENLFLSGRCINRGTFMAFVMKTDTAGNPIKTIAIGAENHGTFGYDIDVTKEGKVAITGFSTILENNFQDRSDLFVGLLENDLSPIFVNAYEIVAGQDLGSLGEGIVEMEDGALAVVAESASFTNHNIPVPQGAGKWFGGIIEKDGTLRKGYIYNHFGSQYPRIKKSGIGGYLIGGFSTEFTLSRAFQGMVIKTDEKLSQDQCTEIDVTNELQSFQPNWIIEDWTFTEKSGSSVTPFNPIKSDTTQEYDVVCQNIPEIRAQFTAPTEACPGELVQFTDQSLVVNGVKYQWEFAGKMSEKNGNEQGSFPSPGVYTIRLTVSIGCISSVYTQQIKIKDGLLKTESAEFCERKSYVWRGKTLTQEGTYFDTIPASGGQCGEIYQLVLKMNPAKKINTLIDTCTPVTINNKIYDQSGIYEISYREPANGDCGEIGILNLVINPMQMVEDTLLCDEVILIDGQAIKETGTYTFPRLCKIYKIAKVECNDCLEAPNVFAPSSATVDNQVFKPILLCPDSNSVKISKLQMQVFNRWGHKVFDGNGPTVNWNGTHKDNLASPDSYLYLLNYDLEFVLPGRQDKIFRKSFTKNGVVTLLR
ncbi:MAG TPA: gliding motility-associated C-terminal domain-containing protein [Saprospiraceae bacterium]|nr:gliding motility-associated C-terminal domain-containing protein [Saprospiraceae bacterium]